MERWFGKHWDAPVCDDGEPVPTPVGQRCSRCREPIEAGDAGFITPHLGMLGWEGLPQHYECRMREIVGGLNHQLGRCLCCGGTEPPDSPEMSKREAARAAVRHWESRSIQTN